MKKIHRHKKLLVIMIIMMVAVTALAALWFTQQISHNINELSTDPTSVSLSEPEIRFSEVASGLDHPWDMVFPTPDIIIYNLRAGEIHGRMVLNSQDWVIKKPDNLVAAGEGGLLGLTLDSEFVDNHYLYACFNARGAGNGTMEVRVERYQLSPDYRSVLATASIVSGIANKTGRHSGCRLTMSELGYLWIGTGDGAIGSSPQDPLSLAGKVLRVTRDGKPVDGNMKAPFDPRIYSYGHRNIQGIVLTDKPLPNGAYGYTEEQGTDKDDELNYLLPGNFGYDPNDKGAYREDSPMTDLNKYPDAISSIWASGSPTLATSGLTQLTYRRWQGWQGRLMIANLKDESVLLVKLSEKGEYLSHEKLIEKKYGRIRTLVQGPDGNIYMATDNGNNQDKIYKVEVICTICD